MSMGNAMCFRGGFKLFYHGVDVRSNGAYNPKGRVYQQVQLKRRSQRVMSVSICVRVAQLVELLPLDNKVMGSIPGTNQRSNGGR